MKNIKIKAKKVNSKDQTKSSTISSLSFFGKTRPSRQPFRVNPKIIGTWEIEINNKNCMICWKKIKHEDEITRCISCHNRFHSDHWKDWISTKKSCPVCKSNQTL